MDQLCDVVVDQKKCKQGQWSCAHINESYKNRLNSWKRFVTGFNNKIKLLLFANGVHSTVCSVEINQKA